jgi:hypothetical protein
MPAPAAPEATTNTSKQPSIQPQPAAPAEPEEGFYHPDNVNPAGYAGEDLNDSQTHPASAQAGDDVVTWVSSGDALRAHSSSWRFKMTLVSLVAGVLVYLITRDVVNAGAVVVAGLLFGFLGARKPPALHYQLDSRGITVGRRRYGYAEFRAFSVADEAASPSIDLTPLKRFLPTLSLHFDQAQRDQIVNVLSSHLPMEAHKRDALDRIANKVRF